MSALLAVLLAGCGKPVPPERMDYVGRWSAPGTTLTIEAVGRLEYHRKIDRASTEITAEMTTFHDDRIVAGFSFISATFKVDKPPHLDGAEWKMTVDGVEFSRSAN
ncbi:MAG: hypothetical protein AAB320_03320 [Elusimicrobiota bacterium]